MSISFSARTAGASFDLSDYLPLFGKILKRVAFSLSNAHARISHKKGATKACAIGFSLSDLEISSSESEDIHLTEGYSGHTLDLANIALYTVTEETSLAANINTKVSANLCGNPEFLLEPWSLSVYFELALISPKKSDFDTVRLKLSKTAGRLRLNLSREQYLDLIAVSEQLSRNLNVLERTESHESAALFQNGNRAVRDRYIQLFQATLNSQVSLCR